MSESESNLVVTDATPTTLDAYNDEVNNSGAFRLYLGDDKRNLDCRFYEAKYPEIESLVMVNVRTIADMGAYVSLLEYNNIEGLILLSELSRRRIRSINKLIRVGRNEVAMVLRVDKEKGYIDLSKRRVSPEDVAACEDRFNKAKAVHGVLRHLAERRKYRLEELYERIAWPLYKRYGHAFDAFKIALAEEQTTTATSQDEDPFASLDVPDDVITELKLYIRRRLAPQPIKIRADVEVSCFTYDGIDAIREALFAGIAVGGTENSSIKIRLIAPPIYVLSTMTLEKEIGIALLQKAIDVILSKISEKGGKMDVKMAPKAVSLKEETELQAMMERLELENREVEGDEPEFMSLLFALGLYRSVKESAVAMSYMCHRTGNVAEQEIIFAFRRVSSHSADRRDGIAAITRIALFLIYMQTMFWPHSKSDTVCRA
ncbi:hypothetical protein ACHAXH_008112 [Discostella pseudostelligera]